MSKIEATAAIPEIAAIIICKPVILGLFMSRTVTNVQKNHKVPRRGIYIRGVHCMVFIL